MYIKYLNTMFSRRCSDTPYFPSLIGCWHPLPLPLDPPLSATQQLTHTLMSTYNDCVLIVSCRWFVSAAWSSWTLRIYSSLPFSSASGPPKCDVFTLWTIVALRAIQVGVTVPLLHQRYSITRQVSKTSASQNKSQRPARHKTSLKDQRVTNSTQVRLCAACTLH
jgi:hypothetical protein